MIARKTARLVPRLVFSASFIGVVPACAIAGCGGTDTSDGGSDAKALDGVAAEAFGVACCFGVADVGFIPDADAGKDVSTDTSTDASDAEGG